MISFSYPPVNTISAQRSVGFSKCLPKFGWEPIVLSRNWAGHSEPLPYGVKVVYTQYRDKLSLFRKGPFTCTRKERGIGCESNRTDKNLIGLFKKLKSKLYFYAHEILDYPDEYTGWIPDALAAGRRIIQAENISVIFSTFGPATSHMIAHRLKQEFNLPWVADFRDLWTGNHNIQHSCLREFLEKRLEKNILKRVDVLTTVSQPLAEKLQILHHKKVVVITNGFDPVDYSEHLPQPTKCFSITYTGNLYRGKRDPSLLFAAIQELMREKIVEKENFCVRFFGRSAPWIKECASAYNVQNVVCFEGIVSHEKAVQRQRESAVLLLLSFNAPGGEGVYTGKVFEYLGARRPILAIPRNEGVLDELIRETNAGVAAGTKEEVKHYLKKWYLEFKEKGYLPYGGKEEIIMRYTREKQTEQLASLLDNIYSPK